MFWHLYPPVWHCMDEPLLVGRRHRPRALHPPHRKRVTESLVRDVTAARHLVVHLVALQHLIEEINVPGGELERLYLAEFIRGERGNDFAQRRERFVQRLSPLPLPDVRQNALVLQLLERLSAARARLFVPFIHGARAAAAVLARLFTVSPLLPEPFLLSVQLLLAGHQAVHWGDGRA